MQLLSRRLQSLQLRTLRRMRPSGERLLFGVDYHSKFSCQESIS